jgi:hypothetical protein
MHILFRVLLILLRQKAMITGPEVDMAEAVDEDFAY